VQIKFTSVPVQDQAHALDFYTKVVGFEKASDLPAGGYRWLTVTSPDGVEGVELLLEPLGFAPARDYQKALYDAGMPATAFTTTDIEADYERLRAAGVVFRGSPVNAGPVKTVLFEDTCGNLINLVQPAV
jgi:catechol 2,3-dioxygenase-like lactoylglutathione lyase family enzyme